MAMMGIKGTWRVYFNIGSEYPFVFSVDDGDTEKEGKFTAVAVHGAAVMKYDASRQPHCWLEVPGEMVVDKTTAIIWGATHARQRV